MFGIVVLLLCEKKKEIEKKITFVKKIIGKKIGNIYRIINSILNMIGIFFIIENISKILN